jgi:hypothetical protein
MDLISIDVPIVKIEDGTDIWRGHAKYLFTHYEDKEIRTVINAELEELRTIYQDRELYVGGIATLTFPFFTSDGSMYFPYASNLIKNPSINPVTLFDKADAIRIFKEIK